MAALSGPSMAAISFLKNKNKLIQFRIIFSFDNFYKFEFKLFKND